MILSPYGKIETINLNHTNCFRKRIENLVRGATGAEAAR